MRLIKQLLVAALLIVAGACASDSERETTPDTTLPRTTTTVDPCTEARENNWPLPLGCPVTDYDLCAAGRRAGVPGIETSRLCQEAR